MPSSILSWSEMYRWNAGIDHTFGIGVPVFIRSASAYIICRLEGGLTYTDVFVGRPLAQNTVLILSFPFLRGFRLGRSDPRRTVAFGVERSYVDVLQA